MKKFSSKLLSCVLTLVITFSAFSINAYAAQVIVADTPIRYAKIPSASYSGSEIGNCSGISINEGAKKLFVAKSSDNERYAMLYYFPNINNHSNYSDFYVYYIKNAGHANAMAIDTNYIYITAWIRKPENYYGTNQDISNKNRIIRIPLSYIYAHANKHYGDTDIPVIEKVAFGNNNGYNKILAYQKNSDNTYSVYDHAITSISRYKTNGKFLIDYESGNTSEQRGFTQAEIMTIDGTPRFVVSTSNSSVFFIKNNWNSADPVYQDMEFREDNGFFLPVWYGRNTSQNTNMNKKKTVIAWADIEHPNSSNSESVLINGVSYTRFIPDKINVNVSSVKKPNTNILMYESFEIESIAFDATAQMYAAVNVINTEAYSNSVSNSLCGDGVYKINHSNGQDFVL